MYLYGGYGIIIPSQPSGVIEQATWVYDPTAGTWSDTGFLMVHPRLWMGYAGSTASAFAAGGTDNLTTRTPLASTEKFTPGSGWVATANLPVGLLGPGEGDVSTHLIVWGGQNSSGVTQSKTYACTIPACTAFSTTAFNLPAPKSFSAFGYGSNIFNAGGMTSGGIAVATAEHLP
jgi:hypothetical protein